MGWDRGYYYRPTRRNGLPRREYVGKGAAAELTSELDEIRRDQRRALAAVGRAERAAVEALDRPLAELNELADLMACAALFAAGYHRHDRGMWRKRRDHG